MYLFTTKDNYKVNKKKNTLKSNKNIKKYINKYTILVVKIMDLKLMAGIAQEKPKPYFHCGP